MAAQVVSSDQIVLRLTASTAETQTQMSAALYLTLLGFSWQMSYAPVSAEFAEARERV